MTKYLSVSVVVLTVLLVLATWRISEIHQNEDTWVGQPQPRQQVVPDDLDNSVAVSTALGQIDSTFTSKVDNETVNPAPLVQWQFSQSPLEFLNDLEEKNLVGDHGVNHYMRSWLETCFHARVFSTHMEAQEKLGRKGELTKKLSDFCQGFLPESFNFGNYEDVAAVEAELMSLYDKTSYMQSWRELHASFEEDGETVFAGTAADLLRNAMDTGTLQATVNSLLLRGQFKSPLLEEFRDLAFSQDFFEVSNDVATVLLCERIGGCRGSDHPIVLQRCFKAALGCDRPVDIYDAIYQLTPPVDYEVFWALLTETRRFMARRR